MPYEEQRERAEERLEKILSGNVKGMEVDIRRGHSRKWAAPLNAGFFGIPGGNRKYVVAPASVHVNDWLDLQYAVSGARSRRQFRVSAHEPTIRRAEESVQFGTGDIPTPVLEVRTSGDIPQEGRSRAMGARMAGAEWIPIWVAVQVYR